MIEKRKRKKKMTEKKHTTLWIDYNVLDVVNVAMFY